MVAIRKSGARLRANDLTILQRCASGPVRFVYAPDPKGGSHAKLLRSDVSPSLRKHFDSLALDGYVARAITGCEGKKEPPETVVTFTMTAYGREHIGVARPVAPLQRVTRLKTNAQLLEEANVRD